MTSKTFTILSIGAPLVEVDGDGPTTDRPDGLSIPDGVPKIAPIRFSKAPVKRFRVDAAPSARARVAITDSPFGVFVRVRRYVPLAPKAPWWRFLAVARWPRLRGFLKDRAPDALAVWYLLTDEDAPAAPSATNGARAHHPFTPVPKSHKWQDVGDDITSEVTAHGGDLVIVTFVTP